MGTLDVGEKFIEHALAHAKNGTYAARENRGQHEPRNKTLPADIALVQQHIEMFLTTEPHHTRKDSQ